MIYNFQSGEEKRVRKEDVSSVNKFLKQQSESADSDVNRF